MGFPRQEYWSGLPFSSPGYLPNLGIEPASPTTPALAGRFFTTEPPGKPHEVSKKKGSKSQTRMTYLGLILTGGQRSLTWTRFVALTLLKLEDSFGASWGWPDFAVSGSLKVKVKSLSHVQLFQTPWTIA